jgi:hypothetical protein
VARTGTVGRAPIPWYSDERDIQALSRRDGRQAHESCMPCKSWHLGSIDWLMECLVHGRNPLCFFDHSERARGEQSPRLDWLERFRAESLVCGPKRPFAIPVLPYGDSSVVPSN